MYEKSEHISKSVGKFNSGPQQPSNDVFEHIILEIFYHGRDPLYGYRAGGVEFLVIDNKDTHMT